jgi:VWFA-related protein
MKNGFALVAAFLAVLMGTPQVARGQSARIQPASNSALLAKAVEPSALSSLPEASPAPTSAGTSATIALDVVVAGKSGEPVSGLQAGEFKLLDNKQPLSLDSIQAAYGLKAQADPPVEVYLILDAINMPFLARANQRQWLMDFFSQNHGKLALPTSLLVLTDNGISEQNKPTRDGSALLRVLDASYAGFMQIKSYERLDGALLREEDSLKALNLFAVQQSKRPGRKLFIWLGHGWTVASNPMSIGGPKKRQNIYNYIASLSTALREARITLYQVIPGSGFGRGDIYMQYVKGVSDTNHVDLGDLSLPVLATQTGGQVLMGSTNLAGLIDRCIADAQAYYVLTFKPPPAAHPREYHDIQVQLTRPGLKARTRSGYYTPPANNEQPPVAISLLDPTAVTQ